MNRTEIDYLTHTWNPLAMRCTPVSPACTNCWHLRMANRLAANPVIPAEARAAYAGETEPVLLGERLEQPLKRKKPAVVGVQFMGDLFHDDVSFSFIDNVFFTIGESYQHTFQILTKRPKRMLEYVQRWLDQRYRIAPLDNVWLGVTVENQQTADERIPLLLQTPAAVRFVSAEPLLGAVDLLEYLPTQYQLGYKDKTIDEGMTVGLDWVITGGETGPGARPMHPDWARGLRDQCQAAGVSYFFKQWGEWSSIIRQHSGGIKNHGHFCADGKWINRSQQRATSTYMCRVGNKRAGHLLDGIEWREMPEVTK